MKSKEKNRSFGLLFFAVFTLICFWPLINGEKPRLFLFPFAIIFLILGILNSKFLTPFNKAWIKFGEFLGGSTIFKGIKRAIEANRECVTDGECKFKFPGAGGEAKYIKCK